MLRIADSWLILGHRLSEWCGHGPVIEEDIALTNIALDLIGQARSLYARAGVLEGKGRSEDEFAFQRNENEFRNVTMAELPNGDYGFTIMRNFLFTRVSARAMGGAASVADPSSPRLQRKSLKETRYHVQHASDWVIRLGDGTDESHAANATRTRHAVALYGGVFQRLAIDGADVGPAWSTLERRWSSVVRPVLDVATLHVPERHCVSIARQRRSA